MEEMDEAASSYAISRTPLGRLGKPDATLPVAVAFAGLFRRRLDYRRDAAGRRRTEVLN